MNVAPDREAENLYLTGTLREMFEAVSARANGDTRTALAMLQGCYLEMVIRLVQDEVVVDRHGAAIASYLNVTAARMTELASAYARGRLATSPQHEGAHLATTLRSRFETSPATRKPHAWDSYGHDDE